MTTSRLLAAAAATLALTVAAPVASAALPTATFVVEKVSVRSTHTWDLQRTQISGPKGLKDPVCDSGPTFLSGSGSQTAAFTSSETARFKVYAMVGAPPTGVLLTNAGGIPGDETVTRAGSIRREALPGSSAGCEGVQPIVQEVGAPYDCRTVTQPTSAGVGYENGRIKLSAGLIFGIDGFDTCPILTGEKALDTKGGSWVQSARKYGLVKLFDRTIKRHVIAAKLVQTFKGTYEGAPWTARTVTEWTVVLKRAGK